MIESDITLEEMEQFDKMYSRVYAILEALAKQYFIDHDIALYKSDTININVDDLSFSLSDRYGEHVRSSGHYVTNQEICCPAAAINRWRLKKNDG